MSSKTKKRFTISSFLPLFFIVILSSLIRLLFLSTVPVGITGDELDYVLNAKAIFLTGSDVSQTWNPLSLTNPPFEYPKGEILYLILAPVIGVFPFSLFIARLPFVFFTVLLCGITYLITKKLIGNKEAVIAGILASINPWMIVFGRTGYDTIVSVSLYFVGFYILLIAKRWWILMSFPFFFVAFFGYVGTKSIFIPFVLVTVMYAYVVIHKKQYLKQYLTLILLCVACIVFFLFTLSHKDTSRIGDLKTPNSAHIAELVNIKRHQAIETPITPLFINKYALYFQESLTQYMGAFSPNLLFVTGEYTPFYNIGDHGFYYSFDFILLIIGIAVLFKRDIRLFIFLGSILLISAIPAALSDVGTSYAIRSSMSIPILIMLIAIGVGKLIPNTKYKYRMIVLFSFIYFVLFLQFFHIYLFQAPLSSGEQSNLSSRIVSQYMSLAKTHNQNIVILTRDTSPETLYSSPFFKQFLFHTNTYNRNTADEIAKLLKESQIEYENIKIVPCSHYQESKNTVVIREHKTCEKVKTELTHLTVPRLSDGGEVYAVYEDAICNKYILKRYPENIKLSDFNIENLKEQEFCETFITTQH